MASTCFDTMILGAGASGLAATRVLADAGQRVILIEARPRLGGRVHTLHDPEWPTPIECGAEFIHSQPPRTLALLHAAHLPYYDMADTHAHYARGKLQKHADFWDRIERVNAALEKDAGRDVSFQEFLKSTRLPAQTKSLAIKYVEGFDAADHKRVGTEWIRHATRAEEKLGEGLMRISAGYGALIDFMAAVVGSTEVRLNSIVEALSWQRGSVAAVVRSALNQKTARVKASRALITLPLGVLQAPANAPGGVRFLPELRAKRQPLARLGMGGVIKVLLRFEQAFWEKNDPAMNFMHDTTDLPIPTWWAQLPMHTPVLTGWVGGPGAARLTGKPAERILDEGLKSLSRMIRRPIHRLRRELMAWHVQDWLADPFARGAYSYGLVGGAAAARELARPIDDTLFFAGEATAAGMVGTVEAAIVTGQRAASEVLKADAKK